MRAPESVKAKAAGIEAGDLLYSVAGTTIDSTDTLKSVLSNHKAGDKVKVIVVRDNQQKSLTVTLSSSSWVVLLSPGVESGSLWLLVATWA